MRISQSVLGVLLISIVVFAMNTSLVVGAYLEAIAHLSMSQALALGALQFFALAMAYAYFRRGVLAHSD